MSDILRLTAGERDTLQRTLSDILSPSDYATLDDWRAAVLRSVGSATGADWGTFVIRARAIEQSFSPDEPRVAHYLSAAEALDRKLHLWERQLQLAVWSRASLWGAHLSEMRRSSYYQDFVRPLRAYDTIGLTVREAGGPLASVHMLHDSVRGRRFGRRGLAVLALLRPAFRVGMQAAADHFRLTASEPPCTKREATTSGGSLTTREAECARLLARRRSNREIADLLGISPRTARRHTEAILRKLGLKSRREVERVVTG